MNTVSERKAVLSVFVSCMTALRNKNTQVEIQCSGSTDAINYKIIQGEGEGTGLCCSVCVSTTASIALIFKMGH